MKKVLHYLNQFFGQIGAEAEADFPLKVQPGLVGVGQAFQKALGSDAEITATIICGDNYFNEHPETGEQIKSILEQYQPDLVIAGPAFFAGRYGMACGEVCKIASKLLIPAVTGMFEDNPAVAIYRNNAFIVPTSNSAAGMRQAVPNMTRLALKLLRHKEIMGPEEDHYFKRNIRVQYRKEQPGAVRAVNMLLHKLHGEPFETELPMPKHETVKPSPAIKDLSTAKIALITSGGIVPTGNPDRIESAMATKCCKYSFEKDFCGVDHIKGEVCHGGYDGTYCNADPNRMLPADVMKELEREGVIGELYPYAYATSGSAMLTATAKELARKVADDLKREGVSGAILTSA